MPSSYYTVKGFGRKEITIQKSRFIATADRAENEEAAQNFIREIKKKHHGANHNCSAYLIGDRNEIQKANDDGEPSGTAGVPMLEVLKQHGLKNTVVVVTRYFGGIKLGAGGLIRAYGRAVTEGLKETGIVQCELMKIFRLSFGYTWLGKMENELRSADYAIKTIDYLEQVEMEIYVPKAKAGEFPQWVSNLTNGQALWKMEGTAYLEKPV